MSAWGQITDLGLTKCRFKFVHRQGRGSNRRAIYTCVAHSYPSGCIPVSLPVSPQRKPATP